MIAHPEAATKRHRQRYFRFYYGKKMLWDSFLELIAALWASVIIDSVTKIARAAEVQSVTAVGLLVFASVFHYFSIDYLIVGRKSKFFKFTSFQLGEVCGFLWTATFDNILSEHLSNTYGHVFSGFIIAFTFSYVFLYANAFARNVIFNFNTDEIEKELQEFETSALSLMVAWAAIQQVHYWVYGEVSSEFIGDTAISNADDDNEELQARKNWTFLFCALFVTSLVAFIQRYTLSFSEISERDDVMKIQNAVRSASRDHRIPPSAVNATSEPESPTTSSTIEIQSRRLSRDELLSKKGLSSVGYWFDNMMFSCCDDLGGCCISIQQVFFSCWKKPSRRIITEDNFHDHLNNILCCCVSVVWVMWSLEFFNRNLFSHAHVSDDVASVLSALMFAVIVTILGVWLVGRWTEKSYREEKTYSFDASSSQFADHREQSEDGKMPTIAREMRQRRRYLLIAAFRLAVGWAWWDFSDAAMHPLSYALAKWGPLMMRIILALSLSAVAYKIEDSKKENADDRQESIDHENSVSSRDEAEGKSDSLQKPFL